MTPRQFGPAIRSNCGRAAASMAWRSSPVNPAEITTAPLVPRAAACSMIPGTVGAGVAMTTRSGVSGSAASEGYAVNP